MAAVSVVRAVYDDVPHVAPATVTPALSGAVPGDMRVSSGGAELRFLPSGGGVPAAAGGVLPSLQREAGTPDRVDSGVAHGASGYGARQRR